MTPLSYIILFVLGPLGIVIITALASMYIHTNYYKLLEEYLRPTEIIQEYNYLDDEKSIINILSYTPPDIEDEIRSDSSTSIDLSDIDSSDQ